MIASAESEPPSRKRLSKDERRAQLLEAAERAFAERGFGSTSFDDIAAVANVTRPLLYVHFSSVEELFLECHRAAREEMQQQVVAGALGAGSDPREQLAGGLAAYFRFVRDRPTRFDLLYGPGSAGGPLAPQTAELRFQTAEQLGALFVAAAPQMPPDEALAYAHIVSGATEQLGKWWRHHPDVPLQDVVRRLMDVVWNGLAATLTQPGARAEG